MGKYNILTHREIVDKETGEILSYEACKQFTTKVDQDSFYMVYIDSIGPLFNLTSASARNLLAWMCSNAEFNTGKIDISTANRKEICNKFGITNATISNNISKLKKLKLIDGDDGSYIINPKIFWKGDNKARSELLKTKEIQIIFAINQNNEKELDT